MKANELMIGDWVQIIEPCKYAGAIGRVKTLIDHKDDETAYFKIFLRSNTIHIGIEDICSDDIRPIPLTREILEKNEFAYCERNGAFYAYAEESYSNQTVEIILFNVESEYRNNQLHINEANYKEETMIHLMECNYVHNLQHVFRVCGIKKEIVL